MSPSHSISMQVYARIAQPLIVMLTGLMLLIGTMPYQAVKGATLPDQAFSISGRVLDGFGNVISGTTVTLSGTQSGTTITDDSGNYSFKGLTIGGNYNLTPSKAGQHISFAYAVSNLSSDQTVNLRLDRYVAVNIRVTDSRGQGLSGVAINPNGQDSLLSPKTNSSGVLILNVTVPENADVPVTLTPSRPGYSFTPSSVTFNSSAGNQSVSFIAAQTGGPVGYIQFSASNYTVNESDQSASITVTRTGDTANSATVSYLTTEGTAKQRNNYTFAGGTLSFAPGETSKTITILITDEAYTEGNKALGLQLLTATGTGAYLGSPSFATLSILENDTALATTNPADDARFFVRQHYNDFLARLPDAGGLDYWTTQITQCGNDLECIKRKRIDVSAAFFLEQEFQKTSFVIYRINSAALGMIPTYTHFMVDRNQLVGGSDLQQATKDFANQFVERGIFKQFYPDSMTPEEFVNKLFDTARLTPFTAERAQEIQEMKVNGRTRAEVLLDVIELPAFKAQEFNPAFVLTQYYGYLRRDPDAGGFDFWLNALNKDPNNYRGMVCAFITSAEYQQRFSPLVTHSNSECLQ